MKKCPFCEQSRFAEKFYGCGTSVGASSPETLRCALGKIAAQAAREDELLREIEQYQAEADNQAARIEELAKELAEAKAELITLKENKVDEWINVAADLKRLLARAKGIISKVVETNIQRDGEEDFYCHECKS
jgi:hypothetical protein